MNKLAKKRVSKIKKMKNKSDVKAGDVKWLISQWELATLDVQRAREAIAFWKSQGFMSAAAGFCLGVVVSFIVGYFLL